jgi:hemerythrin-like domain-containing protein
MKTATKSLEDDHVHILRLIDVMEHIAGLEKPEVSHLEAIISLIRNYADGLHHAREEKIFFPFLEGRGFSSQQGPVAVMLHEHVLGRDYVRAMAENIELFKNGNSGALVEIVNNMKGYAGLLRNHIAKENNILFKMADRVLSEEDHKLLLTRFSEAGVSLDPDEYIQQIDELAGYYDI